MPGYLYSHLEANSFNSKLPWGLWIGCKKGKGSKKGPDVECLNINPICRVSIDSI